MLNRFTTDHQTVMLLQNTNVGLVLIHKGQCSIYLPRQNIGKPLVF